MDALLAAVAQREGEDGRRDAAGLGVEWGERAERLEGDFERQLSILVGDGDERVRGLDDRALDAAEALDEPPLPVRDEVVVDQRRARPLERQRLARLQDAQVVARRALRAGVQGEERVRHECPVVDLVEDLPLPQAALAAERHRSRADPAERQRQVAQRRAFVSHVPSAVQSSTTPRSPEERSRKAR